jgi:tetratricopeptide (TPR) repeat protein
MKIFLSAVSGQFKACRDALRSDLSAVGAEVVVQEDFQQHGASLLEKLERYTASCDRIIALVGDAYGFESEETARPAGQPRRSYTARPEEQRRLLSAMAVCALDGFWLPLTVEIAGLTEAEGDDARNRLVDASLLRMLDRDRQRFQLHALLREELRNLAPQARMRRLRKFLPRCLTLFRPKLTSFGELQAAHAAALERLFADWERRWRECRECLPEVIPAAQYLSEKSENDRAEWLTYMGFRTAMRIGDLEIALRILQQKEVFSQKLGNKLSLQASYGNQAVILRAWGRLEEAMALFKKVEVCSLELRNKDSLQVSYGNQALILIDWGRLEEAFELLKKVEDLCLELGNKDGLQLTYGNQAVILRAWGRLEEAMALHEKQDQLCLKLDNKDGLRRSYCNQALILKDWGRLEDAAALHKKEEALCLELGNPSGLAYCYWNWGLLAREQRDRETEREKLATALNIFTELNMPRERDEVRAELEKTTGAGATT